MADTTQALIDALQYCQYQATKLRVWGGMEWLYTSPYAKRIFDKVDEALAAVKAEQEAPEASNAEDYLRNRYGAYRGHFAWRELEDAFNAGARIRQEAQVITTKAHVIAKAVNDLTQVAKEFHATQQLRSRIQDVVLPLVKPSQYKDAS